MYTRAATARELKVKANAKAKYSPRCTECIDTGLCVILARKRRLLEDFSTLEHLNGKKEEVRIREKDLALDQDVVVGVCSLARYTETKRRHSTATLQIPNLTCPTKGKYEEMWLQKIDNLSQDLQDMQLSRPSTSIDSRSSVPKIKT